MLSSDERKEKRPFPPIILDMRIQRTLRQLSAVKVVTFNDKHWVVSRMSASVRNLGKADTSASYHTA